MHKLKEIDMSKPFLYRKSEGSTGNNEQNIYPFCIPCMHTYTYAHMHKHIYYKYTYMYTSKCTHTLL